MREKQQRPDGTTYFLDIARAVGRRATCLRRRYGAIIVKVEQLQEGAEKP